jgi:Niemann-Pick C1 protein
LLKTKPCGFAVLAISVALLALAVVGVGRIPVGLSEQVSMTVDSDLYNYFTYEKKYIEIGPPAYIVLNNFEYRNATQQAYIKTLTNEISKLKYIQPPVYSWFSTFNNFILQGQEWTEACGAINVDKLPYE